VALLQPIAGHAWPPWAAMALPWVARRTHGLSWGGHEVENFRGAIRVQYAGV
jgi:hypothetical protein